MAIEFNREAYTKVFNDLDKDFVQRERKPNPRFNNNRG